MGMPFQNIQICQQCGNVQCAGNLRDAATVDLYKFATNVGDSFLIAGADSGLANDLIEGEFISGLD
jgi:hypothetical protein